MAWRNVDKTEVASRKKELQDHTCNPLNLLGAGGRDRTDMGLPPLDFESSASTSFTTPALVTVIP